MRRLYFCFKASIEIFEKLGWPYELAKTQFQLGMVYLRRGNVLSSAKLLDVASEGFSRLGARRDLENIKSVKKKISKQELPLFYKRPKFKSSESELVFENLETEFIEDFLFNKLEPEGCGWRSMSEVCRNLNISKHDLYGRSPGTSGPILKELVSTGVVETRTFSGERGRGGEITKIRVSYRKASALSR